MIVFFLVDKLPAGRAGTYWKPLGRSLKHDLLYCGFRIYVQIYLFMNLFNFMLPAS